MATNGISEVEIALQVLPNPLSIKFTWLKISWVRKPCGN
jgi:hypothetical protein